MAEGVKNYMERIVEEMLDSVLKDINACNCETCKMDVAAIALNNLPPRYAVTEVGNLYSKLNLLRQQFEIDVVTQITKAAEIVQRKPRH